MNPKLPKITTLKGLKMEPAELIRLRRAAKLTQAQTAEALGFTLRGYQKLESGASPLKPHHQTALEAIFHKEIGMTTTTSSSVDAGVVIDANLILTQALINKLVALNVLDKTDVADMIIDVIETQKEAHHPNAAGVEALLRHMFVRG
jgi:transcriptional regulator with XRE-family HTH domain